MTSQSNLILHRKRLMAVLTTFVLLLGIRICRADDFPEPHKRYHIESLAAQQQMIKDPTTGAVVGGPESPEQVWVLVPEHPDDTRIGLTTNFYIRFFSTAEFLQLPNAAVDTPVTLVPEGGRDPKQLWRLVPTAKKGYFKLKMTAPGVDSFIAAQAPPHHNIWSSGPSAPEGQSWRFIPEPKPKTE